MLKLKHITFTPINAYNLNNLFCNNLIYKYPTYVFFHVNINF